MPDNKNSTLYSMQVACHIFLWQKSQTLNVCKIPLLQCIAKKKQDIARATQSADGTDTTKEKKRLDGKTDFVSKFKIGLLGMR